MAAAAERHRRGETGVLRVGFEANGAGEPTTRARAEFARRHPGVRVVHTEPRVVGLPSGHALAGRDEISVLDVGDEPLMLTERAPRAWVDWRAVNPRPDGSSPRWGPTNDNAEEMLEQVAEGSAICFAPMTMARYYARPDLSWVPLTDVEPLRTVLAWVDGTDNNLVRGFARVVRELAAGARTGSGPDDRTGTTGRLPDGPEGCP
ncbi:LysR substrate-binding domain-containing protein [Streptomyces sp. NBC_00984]|uniref:LysR substrate-binding domain-containing protein n=1 Tax=Streptomyces sp. NBC_00984 TaxID=2903700 RepID=UPI003868E662